MTDSKKVWMTVKPFFSDKGAVKTDITLIEGNEIVQEDSEVAKILGDFFLAMQFKSEILIYEVNTKMKNLLFQMIQLITYQYFLIISSRSMIML